MLQMSHEEICMRYRDARKKTEQIKILAELNAVEEKVIRDILKAGGYLTPGPKPKSVAQKNAEKEKANKESMKKKQEAAKIMEDIRSATKCKAATINEDFEKAVQEMIEESQENLHEAAGQEEQKEQEKMAEKPQEAAGRKMPESVSEALTKEIIDLKFQIAQMEDKVMEIENYMNTQ